MWYLCRTEKGTPSFEQTQACAMVPSLVSEPRCFKPCIPVAEPPCPGCNLSSIHPGCPEGAYYAKSFLIQAVGIYGILL